MKHLKLTSTIIALLFISNNLEAQNKWSIEFTPNLDFPTKNFGETKLSTGFGFEFDVAYTFIKNIDAYLGWSFNSFKVELPSISEFDERGYSLGITYRLPIIENTKHYFFIRVGGIYNHLLIKNPRGEVIQNTNHKLGFKFGIGFDYKFLEHWSLRPQINYHSLSTDFKIENVNSANLNHFNIGLGLSKWF